MVAQRRGLLNSRKRGIVEALYIVASSGHKFDFSVDSVIIRKTSGGVDVYDGIELVAKGVDLESGLTLFVNLVEKNGKETP